MSERTHYVVTGGCGFVGSNLVAQLLRRRPGCAVTMIDDFSTGHFSNVVAACDRSGVAPFQGECLGTCHTQVKWSDVLSVRTQGVFHLAAITDTTVTDQCRMLAVNCTGFVPLLEECVRGGVPLVYASSAATYGTPPATAARKPFTLAAAGRPNNIYGFSKWLMEGAHRDVMAAGGTDARVVGLRYFNVFGPGEGFKGKMASMIHQLVHQALAGKSPRLFKDGSQARDQVYVDDVVDATLAGAGIGRAGESGPARSGIFNVGSGTATSFNDILAAIRRVPRFAALQADYFDMPENIREFYQDYTCADLSGNAENLGWTPRWKSEDAITEYAGWLAKERRA